MDLQEERYFAETGICRDCYEKRQKSKETCFGKVTEGRQLGYDEAAIECSTFCKDRKVCKEFVDSIQNRVGAGKVVSVSEDAENA